MSRSRTRKKSTHPRLSHEERCAKVREVMANLSPEARERMRQGGIKGGKAVWKGWSKEEIRELDRRHTPEARAKATATRLKNFEKQSEMLELALSKLVREIELTDEEWNILVKEGYCDE